MIRNKIKRNERSGVEGFFILKKSAYFLSTDFLGTRKNSLRNFFCFLNSGK